MSPSDARGNSGTLFVCVFEVVVVVVVSRVTMVVDVELEVDAVDTELKDVEEILEEVVVVDVEVTENVVVAKR